MGTETLTEKQERRLWDILSWDEELCRAYELKELLHAIYAGEDGDQARRELENWFGEVQASGIKEMIEASRTLIHPSPQEWRCYSSTF